MVIGLLAVTLGLAIVSRRARRPADPRRGARFDLTPERASGAAGRTSHAMVGFSSPAMRMVLLAGGLIFAFGLIGDQKILIGAGLLHPGAERDLRARSRLATQAALVAASPDA